MSSIYLEDNLAIYKRESTYYMRLKTAPQHYVYRSLKTSSSQAEARKLARCQLVESEIKQERGELFTAPTFKQVIDELPAHKCCERTRTEAIMPGSIDPELRISLLDLDSPLAARFENIFLRSEREVGQMARDDTTCASARTSISLNTRHLSLYRDPVTFSMQDEPSTKPPPECFE